MAYSDGVNVEKWKLTGYQFQDYYGGTDPVIDRQEDMFGQQIGFLVNGGGRIWTAGSSDNYFMVGTTRVIRPNDPSVFSLGGSYDPDTGEEIPAPFPYVIAVYGPATATNGEYWTFGGFAPYASTDPFLDLYCDFWIGSETNEFGNEATLTTSSPGYHDGDHKYINFYGRAGSNGKRYCVGVYQRFFNEVPVRHTDGEVRTVQAILSGSFEGAIPPEPIMGQAPEPIYAAITARVRPIFSGFASYELPAVEAPKPKIEYEVVNAQTYRTSDFWDYADWYAEGFDATNPPVVIYANSAERNKNENPNPVNLFVKLLDNGQGFWTWTAYIDGKWTVVAQQQGTVQISEKFFENKDVYGWNEQVEGYDFDGAKVRNREGSFDLRVLADAILDNKIITDLEQNELWFSMINFIHSCHDQVDWAFKTSFMTLVGFNEALYDEPVVRPDNTDFILSYVEEVKPYHVTVRDFARSYAPKNEVAQTEVTDFDKPGYYDAANFTYRRLDETLPSDREIMAGGVWQHWLDNMDLARKIKATLKLDRVWYEAGAPSSSAADRIMTFYQPSADMKPKDLDVLMKLDFKGTVLDGMTFDEIDAKAKITQGGTVSDLVDINGEREDQRGFQMRDPRMAEDTPEDMVRLGAHDVILFNAHDKWGAGAPAHIVKTYDTSRLTEERLAFQIGLNPVARTVVVFLDGQRQVENVHYAVDYLANSVFVPLVRESGSRVQRVTIHAMGYGAHTTIIDQVYTTPSVDSDNFEVPVPQSVLDYAGSDTGTGPGSGETPIENPWGYTDIWKYTVESTDAADFSAVDFDDSLWNMGPGGFGSHFDGGNYQVGTAIPSTHTGQTIWLRKSFDAANPSAVGDLHVQFWKDDYATLYWNGEIIPQYNGSTYSAEATIPVNKILVGKNTLALKVVNGPATNIFAALEITAPNKQTNPGNSGGTVVTPGQYYVEVTNNGRFIASSLITDSQGVKKVSFKAQKNNDFVMTYYKGDDHATTYMKEVKMPARSNPNGENLVINDGSVYQGGDYQKKNFAVDWDNRLIYIPTAVANGISRLTIKNIDSNTINYDYPTNLLFMAAVQGTSFGVTQDASPIGDPTDLRPRYRAIQIRDMSTFNINLTIGQNGIYPGAATMTGTTPNETRIPASAKAMTLRNGLANNQVILLFIDGQMRAYDLSGNLVFDQVKNIGWSENSFLVKVQQVSGEVSALLINPDSATQPVKKITLTDTYTVTVEDFKLNGFDQLLGTGGGAITAAAYSPIDNSLILWFYRALGGEAVSSYSLTAGVFRWTTWSNRADLSIADRFHNPRGMQYSRIDRALHIVWVSDKGASSINGRTGEYTSLNADTRPQVGEYQFWDEKTGMLLTSSRYLGGFDGPLNSGAMWKYSINFPDSTFKATFPLKEILLDDLPHVKPYNSSMIVERNGLRLAPPRIYYAVNQNNFYMGEDKVDVSNLYIVDDAGMTSGVVSVDDNAYTDIDQVLQANRAERFLYWKDFLVLRDADAAQRKYAITIAGSGDMNIDDATGILTVNAMTASDVIRTLHWRNDGIMLPQTWSFKAHSSGTYRIKTKSKRGSSWLTVNGRRLVEEVDYTITPVVEGAWDADAFETFQWDDLTEVDITIRNTLRGGENDLIVLTTFEGPQNTPAIDWQHASLTPDIVRFTYSPSDDPEERPFLKEPGAWATETHDLKREGGTTTAPVLVGTGTFNIKINALAVPQAMLATDAVTVPDANQNVPGVVWIGAERIEYFKRQNLGNGIITLDQVRRGTKGTPKQDHLAGAQVRVEHPMRKVPAAPLGDISNVPVPSVPDKPFRPYQPPEFEGWYLKVRFYCTDRGRDAGWYAWNWYFNAYQPNPPRGNWVDWVSTGWSRYEYGSPNSDSCRFDNLCGQPLLTLDPSAPVESGMGGNYHDPYPGQNYNPYDYTYTFYYDQPPGRHYFQQQFGAFNWGSVGKDGSPFILSYRWWNTDWITAYRGYAVGLWPQDIYFDILPAQATVGDIEEALDRNSIKGMPDGYGLFG